MTSSLVGSEMCIRDSCDRAQGCDVHCVKAPKCCHGKRGHSIQWPWAVSYTHLTLPTICSV
eukprot:9997288-Prorocentrum_lima.AAC.1